MTEQSAQAPSGEPLTDERSQEFLDWWHAIARYRPDMVAEDAELAFKAGQAAHARGQQEATPPTPEQAGPSGEALRLLVARAVREWQTLAVAMMELEAAALASPGAMAEPTDAYWLSIRAGVIDALAAEGLEIVSNKDRVWLKRSPGAMEGAQAAQPEPFGYHYAAEGFSDAWSKRRLLGVVPMLGDVKETILYAHPPTGEPT